MLNFTYKRWIKRLKKAKMILQHSDAVKWQDMLQGVKRYLINLPDHERNISVINHYLTKIARDNPHLSLSLIVPEKYKTLFISNSHFSQIYSYPEVRNKKAFPINEELVSHIPRIYDVSLDLNLTPYVVSHYIAATRSTRLSAGFYNTMSSEFFVHTVIIKNEIEYEYGVKSLLKIGGLLDN